MICIGMDLMILIQYGNGLSYHKKIIEKTDKTIFIKIHPNQDIKSIHLVNRMDAEAVMI